MKFINTKATSPHWTQRMFAVVAVIFVVTAVAWFSAHQWYQQNLKPLSSSTEFIVIDIPAGSSTDDIAVDLEEKNIIRSSSAFNWYVDRLDDRRLLQAGTYSLAPNQSVEEIVEILLSGKIDTSLITIAPGLRVDQIVEKLVGAGFDAKEVDSAIDMMYDSPLVQQRPSGASLEGYIFPETYQIHAKTTASSLFRQAFSIFSERIDASITQGLARQGLSLHEGIILASIVQEEVSDPDEQKTVAQVFLKRLAEDIPLGADPTFRYAAYLEGKPETPGINSPYNTRKVVGLPPGPIANFNLSALQAVAEPDDTDFLYFVSGDDGITRFSKTFEEHQAKTDKFCIELCKL